MSTIALILAVVALLVVIVKIISLRYSHAFCSPSAPEEINGRGENASRRDWVANNDTSAWKEAWRADRRGDLQGVLDACDKLQDPSSREAAAVARWSVTDDENNPVIPGYGQY